MQNGKAVFRLACGVLFFVTLASASHALTSDGKVRAFDIPQTEKLGREIYEQDSYAWRATDLVLAEHPDLAPKDISGWLVERRAAGALVRFFKVEDGGNLKPIYDISFVTFEAEPTSARSDGTPVTDDEKIQFAARQLALQSIKDSCSDNYNTVVLKDPERDSWLVYVLAASTTTDVVVGGHYRFSIGADGKQLLESERLSRSCMVMSPPPGGDKQIAALGVTQLVSDTPLETLVFLSLLHKLPFYVKTASGFWLVDGDKISKQQQ